MNTQNIQDEEEIKKIYMGNSIIQKIKNESNVRGKNNVTNQNDLSGINKLENLLFQINKNNH